MKKLITIIAAFALVGLIACGGEEETTTEPEGTTETETPTEAAAEAVEPTEEEVPIPEDFADEAETEVTAENYAAELDRIEAEINSEVEGDEGDEG